VRTRVPLVCLLVLSGPLWAAPPSEASTTIAIPDHVTLTFDGHGRGPGRGMSQYGAQGAAMEGLSTKQIIRFYYPHTRVRHVGGRSVTVLLSLDHDHNTTVKNTPGLQVHSLRTGTTKTLPTTGEAGEASQWRLAPARGGRTKVSYSHPYFHIGWHVWKVLPGDAEFRAPGLITLINRNVGDTTTYRGSLQLRTPVGAPSWDRVTVNKVSLEEYVMGVVGMEMPEWFAPAALRAQAIVTRTEAVVELRSPSKQPWMLSDAMSRQHYGGFNEVGDDAVDPAVVATKGRILTYHGAPVFTPFSRSDGGWTVSGGNPYLPAKQDPYDQVPEEVEYSQHSWTMRITAGTIEKTWPTLGNLTSITVNRRDGNGEWNGRVLVISLHGSKGAVNGISGNTFRKKLNLHSTWFTITV
jgi:stage II sporulation protein D